MKTTFKLKIFDNLKFLCSHQVELNFYFLSLLHSEFQLNYIFYSFFLSVSLPISLNYYFFAKKTMLPKCNFSFCLFSPPDLIKIFQKIVKIFSNV